MTVTRADRKQTTFVCLFLYGWLFMDSVRYLRAGWTGFAAYCALCAVICLATLYMYPDDDEDGMPETVDDTRYIDA